MKDIELGEVQAQFANIIWENEPVSSGELVKICNEKLNWKKSTTYTVLRKLCDKGLFQNENGTVTSLISKDEFSFSKSENILKESFNNSLPAFVAAFISHRDLTPDEAEEIQKMIDAFRKD